MSEAFEDFTSLIAAVTREINRIRSEEMQSFNLKGTDIMCLYYLNKAQGEELSSAELSRQIGCDRALVSRTLNSLSKKGLVQIEQGSGKNYRVPIRLTEEGLELMQIASQRIETIAKKARIGLTDQERQIMYTALRKIVSNLEEL